MTRKKDDENIVTLVTSLADGTFIVEHSDGRLERCENKTDWARVKALTDGQIETSIANDPDWEELKDLDWSNAVFVSPPKKKAISIRVDEDVLDFFKTQGAGYQRRINAVLRLFMNSGSKSNKNNKSKKRA